MNSATTARHKVVNIVVVFVGQSLLCVQRLRGCNTTRHFLVHQQHSISSRFSQFLLFFIEPFHQVCSHKHLLQLLWIFELQISLHKSYLDEGLFLLQYANDVFILHLTIINITIRLESYIVFLQDMQEPFSLALELIWRLNNFVNDFLICESL